MPINKRSQSRRAHHEKSSRAKYSKHFDKTHGNIPTMQSELKEEAKKKKRGNKKR